MPNARREHGRSTMHEGRLKKSWEGTGTMWEHEKIDWRQLLFMESEHA